MKKHDNLERLKDLALEETVKALEDAYQIGYIAKQNEMRDSSVPTQDTDEDTVFNDGVNLGWTLARTLFSDERVAKMYGQTPREVLFNHTAQCVWDTCKALDKGNANCEKAPSEYDELLKRVTDAVSGILADYKATH